MQTINLDISRKLCIPPIYAKQSEVGRKFLAVITDNGLPYNIPDNSLLSVWYEGDTDAGNYSSIEEKSAFSIDGNKVTVELVAQMLLKPGNGELCLSITHGDGGETNTWNIPYCVEYKPGAGSPVPTEYYTALTEAGSMAAEQVSLAKAEADKAAAAAAQAAAAVEECVKKDYLPILIPIGYTFHWSPVEGNGTDLSTPENVSKHFGFGVWEQVKDRFLLGCGETCNAGATGGEARHTLTVDEMPSHSHHVADSDNGGSVGVLWTNYLDTTNGATQALYTSFNSHCQLITNSVGSDIPHNNMPPYLAVYIWRRIA